MRQIVVAGVLVLSAVGNISAQSLCDQAAPASVTVSNAAAHKPQFCAKPSDGIEAYVVYVNGGVAVDLRPLTMIAPPNAAGYALYEGVKELTFPTGTYAVELAVYNREYAGGPTQLSAKSSPLSLTAVANNPPAAAPKLMGVVK